MTASADGLTDAEFTELVDGVMRDYPKQVGWYREGKSAFGFLVGMAIRRSQGRVDVRPGREALQLALRTRLDSPG